MLLLTDLVLAGGVKGFLENPEFAWGVPLLVLGVLGILMVLLPLGSSSAQNGEQAAGNQTGLPLLIPMERSSLWVLAVILGLAMIGFGIAVHMALIIGGVFVLVAGLVGWVQGSRAASS